jgi:hypothetical protein
MPNFLDHMSFTKAKRSLSVEEVELKELAAGSGEGQGMGSDNFQVRVGRFLAYFCAVVSWSNVSSSFLTAGASSASGDIFKYARYCNAAPT